jgi:hypothetical protein
MIEAEASDQRSLGVKRASSAAAANGSNHIALSWPRLTGIDPLTCLDDLY